MKEEKFKFTISCRDNLFSASFTDKDGVGHGGISEESEGEAILNAAHMITHRKIRLEIAKRLVEKVLGGQGTLQAG